MRHQPAPSRGFSLLELTLALSVTAMLALSLYKSMGVCLRARRSATAAVQPVRAATIAMDLVSRDLESILPPTGLLAGPFYGTRQLGSAGDADFVEFCSIGEDGVQPRRPLDEGIRHIELALRTDVTPPVLVRRVTRNLMPRVQPEPEEEVLCRGVRSLSLRYFDGLNWLEDWDSTAVGDVLPVAVQVQIELDEGPGASAGTSPNRMMRIIPLACAKSADASGSGAAAGSAAAGVGAPAAGPSGGTGGSTSGRNTPSGGGRAR